MPNETPKTEVSGYSDMSLCVHHPEVSHEGYESLAVATYRASTIVFPDAEAYRTRKNRGPRGFTYGLNGTPTTRVLEQQIAELERGVGTILAPSGMAAISLIMMSVLRPGDRVAIPDSVYPPVKKFCHDYLTPMGIGFDIYQPDLSDLEEKLYPQTRLIWAESPGSTTMEVQDLKRLAQIGRDRNILTGCDNTWATPLYFKPLDLGIDFSMQALTKYAGGHSDLLMGAVAVNSEALFEKIAATRTLLGIGVSPDDCSLALRGLETMAIRLAHVDRSARQLAEACRQHSSVARILHPAFSSCPGHEIWQRDFLGASGTFSLELNKAVSSQIDVALNKSRLFAIGASWGGTRSLIAPMSVERTDPKKERIDYLRVSIGLEDPRELETELQTILATLDTVAD